MKIKSLLFGTATSHNFCFDMGTLVLRLFFGLSLALAHGIGKMPPPQQLIDGVTSMGFPLPVFFAWSAALSEFAGGILVALGLFTRPAAFFMAVTMSVAAFKVHGADPFNVKELSYLYLAASLSLIFLGGGRFAIDSFLRRK